MGLECEVSSSPTTCTANSCED